MYVQRDPFQPYVVNKQGYAGKPLIKTGPKVVDLLVKVTGIIWEEKDPMAVVSYGGRQQIIGLGDKLFSRKVTKISKKSVWLKGRKKTLIIDVGKGKRL